MVPISCAVKPCVAWFVAGRPCKITSWCVSALCLFIAGRPCVIILVLPGHVNVTRTSWIVLLCAI